ncbi:hypothetical protein [Streptomyces sp. GC420]|uniref:hypothetical protein n=1 Tax=Streptomyces sp. GC420 TaxID=2697568 RepID=UPI001414EB19|nr:hypothetical protein [Streptomyces sp. GC420]NBM15107.1 hypothetical protein [Streptomyces sp. GC420]
MGTEDRDDNDVEAEHHATLLAALREHQLDARLAEELPLHLTGPDTDAGALRLPWGDTLLGPVENAVSAAGDRDQEITVSGRTTELRESDWVKVKTGTAKNAPAYDVRFEEPAELLRMRPGLGDNVHFRVRFRRRLDSAGIARSTEYTYLGPAPEQPSLPMEP